MANDFETIISRDQKSIERGISKAQDKIAILLESYAKQNHRYKTQTGRLQGSTHFKEIAKDIIKGYADAPYAKFIIEGFKSWDKDDFLREAVENNLEKIEQIIESSINKELGI